MSSVYRVDYTTVALANQELYAAGPIDGNSSGAAEVHQSATASAFVLGDTPQEAAGVVAANATSALEIRVNLVTEVATDVLNVPVPA